MSECLWVRCSTLIWIELTKNKVAAEPSTWSETQALAIRYEESPDMADVEGCVYL